MARIVDKLSRYTQLINHERNNCKIVDWDVKHQHKASTLTIWEYSGRVPDSRPMGCRFEPYLHHCVLSLSMTH